MASWLANLFGNRHARPAVELPAPPEPNSHPALTQLKPGATYRITTAFTDFDGYSHDVGETWKFSGTQFLPYEDGLTVWVERENGGHVFRMRWSEEDQGEAISNFWQYAEEVEPIAKEEPTNPE